MLIIGLIINDINVLMIQRSVMEGYSLFPCGDTGIHSVEGEVFANILSVYHLHQGAAHFLCKGPNTKYFKLCKQLLNFSLPL